MDIFIKYGLLGGWPSLIVEPWVVMILVIDEVYKE